MEYVEWNLYYNWYAFYENGYSNSLRQLNIIQCYTKYDLLRYLRALTTNSYKLYNLRKKKSTCLCHKSFII